MVHLFLYIPQSPSSQRTHPPQFFKLYLFYFYQSFLLLLHICPPHLTVMLLSHCSTSQLDFHFISLFFNLFCFRAHFRKIKTIYSLGRYKKYKDCESIQLMILIVCCRLTTKFAILMTRLKIMIEFKEYVWYFTKNRML